MCYTFLGMFISVKACSILYICTNISLILSNINSEEPDAGIVKLSPSNHIIRTNENLSYIPVNVYISQGMHHGKDRVSLSYQHQASTGE